MGEFAKRAGEVEDWKALQDAQRARLEKYVPSSKNEALQKATSNIAALKEKMYSMGYGMRAQALEPRNNELVQDIQRIGMPGREVMIDLPATHGQKQANVILRTILNNARVGAEDARTALKQFADEKAQRGMRVTSDPSTLPWYYPSMTMAAPTSFVSGYQKADSDLDDHLNSHLDKQVEHARKQFEDSLQTEYDNRPFKKSGSAADFIAGLAYAHVKKADGELNQAAGVYGSLAALLASGGYVAGQRWAESNDPRQQRLKALKDTIYQRMSNKPLPVLVSSKPLPEDQNIELKSNMSLPVPGELLPKKAEANHQEPYSRPAIERGNEKQTSPFSKPAVHRGNEIQTSPFSVMKQAMSSYITDEQGRRAYNPKGIYHLNGQTVPFNHPVVQQCAKAFQESQQARPAAQQPAAVRPPVKKEPAGAAALPLLPASMGGWM